MKRLLITLAVICGFVIVGTGIFIATFDADHYRPLLVSEFQKAIGRPVKLERISLAWRGGMAMQLQGLGIYEDAQAQLEPLIQVESASALVHLMPLLRKKVQVASVILSRARIHVVRDAQGNINLMGLAAAASPAVASSQTTPVGEAAVSFNVASLRIEDGSLHWTDAETQPPTDLWMKALDVAIKNISPGQPMDVDVKGALASETPNVHLIGRFTPPGPTHKGSLEQVTLTIENLSLDAILPAVPPGEPQLRGKLTATLQGGASTLDPERLTHSISGSGNLKLAEPKVANLNVLRAVFEKFSMIPGLVERLEARLPQEYQAKIAAKDTMLLPIDVSMQVETGLLQFNDLSVRTDTFGLSGTGTVGLDGTVNIRSTLRIDPVFSAALIESVNELQSLTNSQGAVEIPVVIQGQARQLAVLPDLNYVASKLVVAKVQDLLGNFLQKVLEEDAPTPPNVSPQPAEP
jgi:hypothetical protein